MGAVVEHCRDVTAYLAENILAYDYESHTGRTYVLLCATIDHSIFAYIYRTAHDVR